MQGLELVDLYCFELVEIELGEDFELHWIDSLVLEVGFKIDFEVQEWISSRKVGLEEVLWNQIDQLKKMY